MLKVIKDSDPTIDTVYLRQDNAGCYHSASTILSVRKTFQRTGITVKRKKEKMDFSDLQGGKGPCDRKATHVKRHINVYLNEGNDIQRAQQMKVAINSNGGVSGALPVQVEVSAEPEASNISWSGISYLNNFEFTEPGLRVWRSYNIGPGKVKPYNRFSPPGIPEIKVIDDTGSTISASFQPLHSKRRHVVRLLLQPNQEERSIQLDAEDSDNGVSDNSQAVFTCPEDACIMTYIIICSRKAHRIREAQILSRERKSTRHGQKQVCKYPLKGERCSSKS